MKSNVELTLHHPYHIDKRERKVCLEMSQVYPYPTTRFKNFFKKYISNEGRIRENRSKVFPQKK
jgi:hypothetical protein